MRLTGSIIIFILVGVLAFYVFGGHAGSAVSGKLSVETLMNAVGLQLDDNLRQDILNYREMFANQGFMAFYRECYGIALDSHKFDFARQFAAVSCILVIGQYEVDSDALRASAQRLFINFCRLSLVDKISAVEINNLVFTYNLFDGSAENVELWNDYLEHVWKREVMPKIRRYGTVDDYDKKFIAMRENFSVEASALLSRHGRSLE